MQWSRFGGWSGAMPTRSRPTPGLRWLRSALVRPLAPTASVAVYAPSDLPLSETHALAPVNAYGRAKLHMEQAIASAPGPRSVILRIGSVAGAESLFATGLAKGRITLDRFPDGYSPLRSYIGPRTLARVLGYLSGCPVQVLPHVLNMGGRHPVRMQAMADAMGWPVEWNDSPAPGARQVVVADTSRLWSMMPEPAQDARAIAAELHGLGWPL